MTIRIRHHEASGTREETVKNESILEALEQWIANPKRRLMFVHRKSGAVFFVRGFDSKSGRVLLIANDNGVKCKPKISERESRLYYPKWR